MLGAISIEGSKHDISDFLYVLGNNNDFVATEKRKYLYKLYVNYSQKTFITA